MPSVVTSLLPRSSSVWSRVSLLASNPIISLILLSREKVKHLKLFRTVNVYVKLHTSKCLKPWYLKYSMSKLLCCLESSNSLISWFDYRVVLVINDNTVTASDHIQTAIVGFVLPSRRLWKTDVDSDVSSVSKMVPGILGIKGSLHTTDHNTNWVPRILHKSAASTTYPLHLKTQNMLFSFFSFTVNVALLIVSLPLSL